MLPCSDTALSPAMVQDNVLRVDGALPETKAPGWAFHIFSRTPSRGTFAESDIYHRKPTGTDGALLVMHPREEILGLAYDICK